MNLHPIYYDTRGFGPKAEEYKNAIKREFPEAEETFLEVGDLVSSRCGIEIKTVPDFLASITDERLRYQPVHLKENFEYPMVLILGSFTDIIAQNILNGVALKSKLKYELTEEELKKKQIRIHENSIFGALIAIVVRHKIPVMLFEDINIGSLFTYIDKTNDFYPEYVLECIEFAKLYQTNERKYLHAFRAVHYFINKANDGKVASDNVMRRTPSVADQQSSLVMQLPNIGKEISINLLTEFQSIQNLFNQTPDELIKVDKVGPVIAERVYELITRKFIK